jgi:hypothetical protein
MTISQQFLKNPHSRAPVGTVFASPPPPPIISDKNLSYFLEKNGRICLFGRKSAFYLTHIYKEGASA